MSKPRQTPMMVSSETDREESNVLYRFFDANGRLLYIGVTANIKTRWKDHSRNKPHWRDVATATIEHFDSQEEVIKAEAEAIAAERPAWNVVHNTGRPLSPDRPISADRRAGRRTIKELEEDIRDGEWITGSDACRLFGMRTKDFLHALEKDGFLIGDQRLTIRYTIHPGGTRYLNPQDVLVTLNAARAAAGA